MSSPLVSVVIPAYNHADYIVETIESALSQDLADLECIVIDDASSDDTWQRISSLQDPRLKTFRHEHNQGAHATLNEGLDRAQGRYLAILNSDDRYLPGRLSACIKRLEAGYELVGTDIQLIDGQSQDVTEHWWVEAFEQLKQARNSSEDWVAALLEGNVFMTTSNMVFTRELWQGLRPLRKLRYVHDYDLALRAIIQGARLDWIDTPLLNYRLHESNTISDSPLNANLECTALLREHLPALLERSQRPQIALQHLASQWRRCERYEVEILHALQHEALVRKDADWGRMVEDRNHWIAERDTWIAERDETIQALEHLVSDRDEWVAQRDTWIAERDAWIRERDDLITSLSERLHQLHARPIRYMLQRVRERSRSLIHGTTQRGRRALGALSLPSGAGPFPSRVKNFAALRELVENRGDTLSCISFDVFDTLVQRCIEPPEWIHQRVAQELARELQRPEDSSQIWAARYSAEKRLRQQALQAGKDHECHYDELLQAWLDELGQGENHALIARIEAFESHLEHLALVAKPGAADFLNWARARGLRLVAISDMYLGETHVREILTQCGLVDLLDAIHVSSEYGFGKYSTRLHVHILEVEGFLAKEVLHVGDNLYADAFAPSRIGIHGTWFDEAAVRRRRRRQKLAAAMASQGGIWPGRMQAEIVAERLALDERAQNDEPYFRYGLEVLGPMFSLFTLGLVEKLRESSPEKLMFLARDGHLFMRLYEHWRELDACTLLPAPTYIYASRRVVTSAAVADGLKAEMIPIALANPKQRGLESILKTYGLPPAEFAEAATKHGFDPIEAPLAGPDDPRLDGFLADEEVQAAIRGHGTEARELLQDYFQQEGFFDAESVALVDIGWNGTIQHFLAETFGARAHYPAVTGYYFAQVNSFHAPSEKSGPTLGLLLDAKRGNPCERAPLDFEELFEQGARALEATTLAYRRDENGRIVPVLKPDEASDRKEELRCNPLIAAMQEGVLLHLEHFHAARELTGFDFETLRPYSLGLMERAVVYPEPSEVALIGELAHSEDFGHDHLLDISGRDIGWKDFLRPRRLAARLRGQAWRYAPFARFRSPIPALLARIQHLRQIKARH